MAETSPPTPTRAAFAFVFVTVALDMLALGIMVPVLPKLIIHFEGGNIARAAAATGVFGFAWAAMQFIFSPVLGALSDRFGRRTVILLSNFGLGLDYVLMALAPNLSWLFLGRIVSGITASSFSTAGAYISDVTPAEERASRFGMLGAAFGLGFIIGPALGGLLGQYDLRLPFWVAAALSLLNAAYGFFVLPESLPIEKRSEFQWRKANPVGALALLRSHPRLLGLSVATFLYYIAHESLPSMFVLYTDYRYHWAERTVGLALAAVGLGSTVVSAILVRPAVKKMGERGALFTGLIFGAIGFALYGLAPRGAFFWVGIPFVSVWGLVGPSMQGLMTRTVSASEQGRLQGALSSLRGVTGMLGPLLFTQIFAAAIHPSRSFKVPGAPYLLAALLLVASLTWSLQTTSVAKAQAGNTIK